MGSLLICAALAACGGDPDPRTVEGALAKSAEALGRKDATALFRVIDQRARHAMASIVESRHEAAAAIEKGYPAAARPAALAELGDAATAKDAADLFRLRCDASCLDGLAAQVGAPLEQKSEGAETVVRTARGSELRLFRGSDTWYGIVWRTDALVRERDRAAAELDLVNKNAELYAKQNQLK